MLVREDKVCLISLQYVSKIDEYQAVEKLSD